MRAILRIGLKFTAILIGVLGAVFFVLVNYSAVEKNFTCEGKLGDQPDIAYVVLSEYRWWVRLWSDSDGDLKLQFDKRGITTYVPFVDKSGDGILAVYSFHRNDKDSMIGGLRIANGELVIKIYGDVVFIGRCSPR